MLLYSDLDIVLLGVLDMYYVLHVFTYCFTERFQYTRFLFSDIGLCSSRVIVKFLCGVIYVSAPSSFEWFFNSTKLVCMLFFIQRLPFSSNFLTAVISHGTWKVLKILGRGDNRVH